MKSNKFLPCCEVAMEAALEDVDALDAAAADGGRFDCSICDRDLTRYVLASSCRRMLDDSTDVLRQSRERFPDVARQCPQCGWWPPCECF